MKQYYLIFSLFLAVLSVYSQTFKGAVEITESRDEYNNFPIIQATNQLKLMASGLPSVYDNSDAPALRPVFSQSGWSCGQAASIGYVFTYELNSLRGLPSDTNLYQYTPYFPYNFLNEGEGNDGVHFDMSSEIIRKCGTPAIAEFSDDENDLEVWMNGYENYLAGMKNKLAANYAFKIGDEEELLMLKSWIYNHFGSQEFGGLANIYFDLPSTEILPPGTPEEGKHVLTSIPGYYGHAVTFVGWNDSICWDYNEDGQYTNHLDINDDGVVNMRDWEIGGVKLVNTHGPYFADSGFCYMMYQTFAELRFEGGLAIKYAYVMDVNPDYEPLLTMKVDMQHNSRNKIKLSAGISNQLNGLIPEFVMDFPIFNFQGGEKPLKGNAMLDEPSRLEFGLDVTPLLGYLNTTEEASFFLMVEEYDPENVGLGYLNNAAVLDYSGSVQIVDFEEENIPIMGNNITMIRTNLQVENHIKPEIISEQLPPYIENVPYTFNFEAAGGTGDYTWNLLMHYFNHISSCDYPAYGGENVTPSNTQSGYTAVPLNFEFPFFGQRFDTLFIHVDGIITFDDYIRPIPYQQDDLYAFRNGKMIAPFYSQNLFVGSGEGILVDQQQSLLTIRWQEFIETFDGDYIPIDFSLWINSTGSIECYFQEELMGLKDYSNWISGVSNGDDLNYQVSDFSNLMNSKAAWNVSYVPSFLMENMSMNSNGLLSFTPGNSGEIFNISIQVLDENRVFDRESFLITDGLAFELLVDAGGDEYIEAGESVLLDLLLSNHGAQTLSEISAEFQCIDAFVGLLDGQETGEDLDPGESILLEDAFSFTVAEETPDIYNIMADLSFYATQGEWNANHSFITFAPVIQMGDPVIIAGDNGRLDIGETGEVVVQIVNRGHSAAYAVEGFISDGNDPFVSIIGSNTLELGTILGGEIKTDTIIVSVSENAYNGYHTQFNVILEGEPSVIFEGQFELYIGRIPVLIIDLDPSRTSGPVFDTIYDLMGVEHTYENGLVTDLNDYGNLILCLGRYYDAYVLSNLESDMICEFFEEGGNVYMEGAQTWFTDPQTPAHDYFSVLTEEVSWEMISEVSGVPGTFSDGLIWEYNADMAYTNYYMLENIGVFSILKNPENEGVCALAQESEDYKSIASLILMGFLGEEESFQDKIPLVEGINQFFNISVLNNSDPMPAFQAGLTIYPNPVDNKIFILSPLSGAGQLFLYDLSGNLIMNENIKMIEKEAIGVDVSNVKKGIYLIKLILPDLVLMDRLIKM